MKKGKKLDDELRRTEQRTTLEKTKPHYESKTPASNPPPPPPSWPGPTRSARPPWWTTT